MTQILTFGLGLGAFLAVIITIAVLVSRRAKRLERERTLGLKSSATLLGWQFGEEAPLNYLPNLDKFALFSAGHSKQIKNLIYGETNGVKAAVFDYVYVTGGGKHQQTHHQSVVYFEPSNLNLPFFSLRPENFLHKFIAALGYQDIDFGNRPTFSSQYLLRGNDEAAIRNMFSAALLAFYETNPGIGTDGGGNQIFIFRQGYSAPPDQIRAFIDWAAGLQSVFPRQR